MEATLESALEEVDALTKKFWEWDIKHQDEYLEFARIPPNKRFHDSPTLCGMAALAALSGDPASWEVTAARELEGEILMKGPPLASVLEADFVYLLRCGIRYNLGCGCFSLFV